MSRACNSSESRLSVPSAGLRWLQSTPGDKSAGGELPVISFHVASQTCGFAFPFGFPCPYRMTFRCVRSCQRCLTGLLWPQQGHLCPPCPLLKVVHRRQQVRDTCTSSPPSCELSGYSRELLQHRNLPRSFRRLTKHSNDMKALGFVWEEPWTSSLGGCHPSSAAAGCLAIVFAQPEHRDSPPEMSWEEPAELGVRLGPPELATSPFPPAKPREKLLLLSDSAGQDHFLRNPRLVTRCWRCSSGCSWGEAPL